MESNAEREGKRSPLTPSLSPEERTLLAQKELDAAHEAWEAADVLVTQVSTGGAFGG